MIKGFLNLSYFGWAVIALIVAGIFLYVWPHQAVTTLSGFRYLVIRFGHALTWILLAVSFFLRGLGAEYEKFSNPIAAAGGLVYLLFMVMTFVVK